MLSLCLFLLFVVLFSQALPSANVSPAELVALYDLYVQTFGEDWNWQNVTIAGAIWNFTVPDPNPCNPLWQGITCSCGIECSVVQLQLSDYNLNGTLPDSLDNLNELTILDLSYNYLEGRIPQSIGNLKNLTSLNLEENYYIIGKIPDSFAGLNNLVELILTDNFLSGSIPSFIYDYQYLQTLELGNNEFSGTVSESLGSLGTLRELHLDDTYLSGPIPQSIGELTRLEILQLSFTFINGTIPYSVCRLSNVTYFDIAHNQFTGTIPSCIGNLSSVVTLSIGGSRQLKGPIPASIVNLSDTLVNLQLFDNKLTGSIDAVYSLDNLEYLHLNSNHFIGSLTNITKLINVKLLDMSYNYLTGYIPSAIGNLTHMEDFRLSYNSLIGSIPLAVCNLTSLYNIDLKHNNLVGPIPECLHLVSNLTYLDLNSNNLTGSIPHSLVRLNRSLSYLSLYANRLTGHIPPDLLNATEAVLRRFDAYNNSLTGPLPPIALPLLFSINLQNNHLSGSLHDSLSQCKHLTVLSLAINQLTGSFPSLAGMEALNSIDVWDNQFTGPLPVVHPIRGNISTYTLNNNHFTGTIPIAACNVSVQYFEVSSNLLHGTVPMCVIDKKMYYFGVSSNLFSGLSKIIDLQSADLVYFDCSHNLIPGHLPYFSGYNPLVHLKYYYAQNNKFSGPAPFSYEPDGFTVTLELLYLDVSNNQLTGTIPDSSTIADSLESFAMGSNCLTGPIPPALCQSTKLLFLDLDGVSTAESCRKPIFPGSKYLTSYTLKNQMTGGIPNCLFQVGTLETLHLSGNGLEWSFPADFNVTAALTDLTLSHNKITGTIPEVVQQRQWRNLDLSYNKLTGSLRTFQQQTDPAASIVLQVNRLSGAVPGSLLSLEGVNILTGNMFGCNLQRDQLPSHDPAYKIYQCGSNALDESILIWGCFCLVAAAVAGAVVFTRYYWYRQFSLWFKSVWSEVDLWLRVVQTDKQQLGGLLSSFYAATVGVAQSIVKLTVVILVVFLPVYGALKAFYATVQDQYAWTVSAAFLSGEAPAVVLLVFYLAVVTFMYVVWYKQSRTVAGTTTAAAVDSATKGKTSYVNVVLLWLVVLVNCLVMVVVNGGYVYIIVKYNTETAFAAQVAIALFKLLWNDYALREMIALPRKILTALSRGDESVLLLEKSRNMSSGHLQDEAVSLPYLSFIVLFNSIVAPCLATAAVDSNCFLNAFIAPASVSTDFPTVVFTESCFYNGTVYHDQCKANEASSVLIVSYDPPFTYNYQCASAILTNYASVYVFMFLMVAFLKPLALYALLRLSQRLSPDQWWGRLVDSLLMRLLKPASEADLGKEGQVLFRKENFILRCVSKLAVFATFGVVFPLLTVVICVSFISEVGLNLLIMGRFLASVGDESSRSRFSRRLGLDCEGCWELLLVPLVSLVVPFAAFFYALFVFDVYGDAVGYKRGIWASAVLTGYPWLLRLAQWLFEWRVRTNEPQKGEEVEMRETELSAAGKSESA